MKLQKYPSLSGLQNIFLRRMTIYISAGYSKKLAFYLKSHRDHNTLYLWNCQYIYYFKPALAKSVASGPPPTASITILDQTKTALSQVSALNIKYPK